MLPINITSHRHSYTFTITEHLEYTINDYLIQTNKSWEDTLVFCDNAIKSTAKNLCNRVYQSQIMLIAAQEQHKTFSYLQKIIDFIFDYLDKHNQRPSPLLIVMGGGFMHDLVGLAASLIKRGLPWIYCPSTLLAQVDTAVGGKTAVHYHGQKNQIGTYYPPQYVIATPAFLYTLSPHNIYAGLGEIIKTRLLDKLRPNLHTDLDTAIAALFNMPWAFTSIQPYLNTVIQACIETKKYYIEKDEFDHNERQFLNLGHTLGHAIESFTHFSMPHGCAVAWGVSFEIFCSEQLGIADTSTFDAIKKYLMLIQQQSPLIPALISIETLISLMRADKKKRDTHIPLILLKAPGEPRMHSIDEKTLSHLLTQFFNQTHFVI